MLAHPAYVRRNARYGDESTAVRDAAHNFAMEHPRLAIAGLVTVFTVVGVQVFGINPWIVKAFKPEWSYGRRLAASFGVTFAASTLISAAKGIGGKG
jgi:hypothetical protein